jgi:2-keto-4-pentenoate hydratase/2-oxohepta-3-ene-1,7-dioic acid hydratase in catechol pathway
VRWLRFTANDQSSWGIVEGDQVITISGDPLSEWQRTPRKHSIADVKIELPLMPRTFYCVGLNYLRHLKEAADKRGEVPNGPGRPEIGYRAQNALIAHDEAVVIPATATEKIHYEGELVVVIGKKAKHLSARDAMSASAAGRRPTADCGGPRIPTPSSRWDRGSKPRSISTRWKPSCG